MSVCIVFFIWFEYNFFGNDTISLFIVVTVQWRVAANTVSRRSVPMLPLAAADGAFLPNGLWVTVPGIIGGEGAPAAERVRHGGRPARCPRRSFVPRFLM